MAMARDRPLFFFFLFLFLFLFLFYAASAATPRELFLVPPQTLTLDYHNGSLLTGNYTLHLLWYGRFPPPTAPSTLSEADLARLAARLAPHRGAIAAILTSPDVLVDGFCVGRCGLHGAARAGRRGRARFAYLWAGDSSAQCPGQCAWPFHRPIYGPQAPPLVPPNGDVGVDGVIINLATLLAGAVTNPFGDGFFQGPATAPLEAATACAGCTGRAPTRATRGSCWWTPPQGRATTPTDLAGGGICCPPCGTQERRSAPPSSDVAPAAIYSLGESNTLSFILIIVVVLTLFLLFRFFDLSVL
uniref:Protein EXORDIUM-like 2 n=1 Tax=Ananas comosus var. bracteatus TaxID=296719 RepID=A0A6V7P6N9_ANACO|nr:unnamed protein product [Ananas comosus var. bracteatus]